MIKWYSDEMVEGCTTDRYFVSFTGALNPNSEDVGHSASETHVQLFAFDFEPLASARPSSSASDSYPPFLTAHAVRPIARFFRCVYCHCSRDPESKPLNMLVRSSDHIDENNKVALARLAACARRRKDT